MIQKTILLTGASGLLGQKIVKKLAGRKAVKLIATDKGENKNPERGDYVFEQLDIRDEDRLRALMQQYKPTDVINCAAITHVDLCEKEKELCWAVNVIAVEKMAYMCRDLGARLIHLSTDFIFDGEAGPYKEKDLPNPLSYYGKSKLKSEELILDSGVDFTIIRTILLYGVVPDLGRSNIILWVRKALMEGRSINVVDDQWRTPTLAEDLADGVILATMKEKTGIFHISGSELMNMYELAQKVAQFFGLDKNLIQRTDSTTLGQAAKRPPKTGFIIIKAQTELGYQPRSFTEGLEIVEKQLQEWGG